MFKRFLLIFIALFLMAGLSFSQTRKKQSSGDAKVFYVNLYSENVDVRLGEENNKVFFSNDLEPYSATVMVKITDFADYKLYFKKSADEKFFYWIDDNKKAIVCPVEAGKNYCILIDSEGTPHYLELSEDAKKSPKLCFLNGTDTDLPRMELGTEWSGEAEPGDTVAAYIDGLEKDSISTFVSVAKGDYSCYWQFPNQKKKGTYYFDPDDSGDNPIVYTLEDGKYYVFFAYTEGRSDYAKLLDITP